MSEFTRRKLLERAAVAGAGATLYGAPAAFAAKRARPKRPRRVAVLGGGMAGLAAAHELAERGFDVTVYERNALGGKARSIPAPGTARGGRRDLPGEHGFRFFPGFYHHVPDSMRRIPYPGNPNGVWDNLTAASLPRSPRTEGRPDAQLFGIIPDPTEAAKPGGLQRLLVEEATQKGISPVEGEYFAQRVMVFLTSCDERRFGQWEHVTWWDYVGAASRSEEYQHVIARGLTRSLVAAKETVASTRTIGNMAEAILMNIMGRGADGEVDRVLDAPTNEAWIDPWVLYLKKLGVRFRVGRTVEALAVRNGRIQAARVRDPRGRRSNVVADWFVSAMPVERARRLLSPAVLALDPSLAGMHDLQTDWMSGIQFFLKRKVELTRGHVTFVDSPWALTALTQGQFWKERDFAKDYGDGGAVDALSVDISDWDTPGILFGRPAKQCTREEVAKEVLEQIKAHLNDNGTDVLTDDMIHSWHLDPAIAWSARHGQNRNDDPLLVNTIGSWFKRPTAATKVPNFFLAGDYVRTDVDLATMEGANESGRAAVNALLTSANSSAEPVRMFKLYVEPELEAAKAADAQLYRGRQPNALDKG